MSDLNFFGHTYSFRSLILFTLSVDFLQQPVGALARVPTQRPIKAMASSQGNSAFSNFRSMTTQDQSQRETSPHPSRTKRTLIACVRCRARKVKCIPLDDQPERTCQRCCDGGLQRECKYISVTEEENRKSRSWDPEPAHGDLGAVLASFSDGTPPVRSPGNMPWLGENMTDSIGASSPPWTPVPEYPTVSHVDANTWYGASPYLNYPQGYHTHGQDIIPPASFSREGSSHDAGPWPSQLQGHTPSTSTFPVTSNATASYGYSYNSANADQDMHAAVVMRNPKFPGGYSNNQNHYGRGNPDEWYDDGPSGVGE
ncbi:hypothetical protein L208DRAFT_1446976 [Tricholoma matsutake]|nr:hypothetical protein L208DRAFT_1446976 [Tricholoma matsutake 945]